MEEDVFLDFEAQISHALFVSFNQVLARLLALLHDALVPNLLRFRTGAAWLLRFRFLFRLFLGFDFRLEIRHVVDNSVQPTRLMACDLT